MTLFINRLKICFINPDYVKYEITREWTAIDVFSDLHIDLFLARFIRWRVTEIGDFLHSICSMMKLFRTFIVIAFENWIFYLYLPRNLINT